MNGPFLTDVDSRAQIKGSRDPLGVQVIWTRLGRYVVGNLTTVSSSVRDFSVLLLGYHFISRAIEERSRVQPLDIFLKWEQLAGYVRAAVNKDWSFRGTDRVRRNLGESNKVILSADRRFQILSNQKTYGLWGLYSGPGRASGLIEVEPPRLSSEAAAFVDDYVRLLTAAGFREGNEILELLLQPAARIDIVGREKKLVEAIARVLAPRIRGNERVFYRSTLLYCESNDTTDGRQRQLAGLLEKTLGQKDFAFSPRVMRQLAKEARTSRQPDTGLAFHLDRIRACESLIATASNLFAYLLGQDGRSVKRIVEDIKEQWGGKISSIDVTGIESLQQEFTAALGDPSAAKRWLEITSALTSGKYEHAIQLLLGQNSFVMGKRGGAPWSEVERGRLKVRFRDETSRLRKRDELANLWRYSYFMDSLREVARALHEVR